MQVHLESASPDASLERTQVLARARFALRRMSWAVPRAELRLMDLNGPRGGVDKQCRVELRTAGHGRVVVTAVAGGWGPALDAALSRAVHALRRLLHRRRAVARGPAPGALAALPDSPAR